MRMRDILWNIIVMIFLPIFFIAALLPSRKRKMLIWGSSPIISNKYWSRAMRESGYATATLMEGWFSINARADFDLYFEDFASKKMPRMFRIGFGTLIAFVYVLRNARVVHIPFSGFSLNGSIFWRCESIFLKMAKIKIIALPFGGDFYKYSMVIDPCLRYGLLASYPKLALRERSTTRRVEHWTRQADAVVAGFMVDALGRWDVTTHNMFVIDTCEWRPKSTYSNADGIEGTVRIMHTPNHRGFKGTEFVVDAVRKLKSEGLSVELVLLEGLPNAEIRRLMQDVDILAEQFLATAYAMSGIEGMASGLPVLANLEHQAYTRVFRRFGALNECPVVSTTPEDLERTLRILVRSPRLREELGRAGRQFVEKYHSYSTAQYLFGAIYRKILNGEDIDLMNLFHPLKSEFNGKLPRVVHPLRESRLPE